MLTPWLKTAAYGAVAVAVLHSSFLIAATEDQKVQSPWWKQEKIRFLWGQWSRFRTAGVPMEEVFDNLSRVGATVFVEDDARVTGDHPGFRMARARLARERGIRYFGAIYSAGLAERGQEMNAPPAVTATGDHYRGYGAFSDSSMSCPLYEPLYHEHLLKPMLEAAATGCIDGMHLDWEPYGRPEPGMCYCHECFSAFLRSRGLDSNEDILAASRHPWLQERRLLRQYEKHHQRRRLEMFSMIRDRVHDIKSDFVFAGYHVNNWAMRAGLHCAQAPLFVVDQRHYWEDGARPWWQSYYDHEHKLGYIHIAGSYNITFFGFQPETQASAAQWMYDAAVNTDGVWLWFEEEFGPEMWRSFWSADRRIRATEQHVGKFLLQGLQDRHFVVPINWSGDPQLARKIIQRTYHLGQEHLVHVNNVDTDRPVQVRLRFVRLAADSRWIVRDPMSGLTYTRDDNEAIWNGRQLDEGILVSLENRSDLFLQLSPPNGGESPRPHATLGGQLAPQMPDHPQPEASVMDASAPAGQRRLVYTRTEDMGYLRPVGTPSGWSVANAIWSAQSDGAENQRLRQLKGYLWAPVWSPDGTRIAFCHYARGRGQIYVMSADASRAVNVSNNTYCDRSPVWSPDGKKLAFVSDRAGNWDIHVMNGDGSAQETMTADAGRNQAPVWSPDGASIAFESDRRNDVDIFVMDADGRNQRPLVQLPGDQTEPAWSPNGSEIAFVGLEWTYPNLSVVTVETGQVRKVLGDSIGYVGAPTWSPDGTRIAGIYRRTGYGVKPPISGIFAISPDGRTRLGQKPDENTLVTAPIISPYHAGRRDPSYIPTWYSYGSASPRWVLGNFSGLCWSPDGATLAFSANLAVDGYFHVYTVSVDGGPARMLKETASAWPQAVDWSQQ